MKAYIIITGAIFGLIVVAHIARMFAEGPAVIGPVYILLTIAAAALCFWAWRLLRTLAR